MIPISKIINVDFNIVKQSPVIGSYKTVLYLIPDEFKIDSEVTNYVLCTKYENINGTLKFYNNEGKEITDLSEEIKFNIKQYFVNGGIQLLLIRPSGYTEVDFKSDLDKARTLTNDFIYIVINNTICDNSSGYTTTSLKDIAEYIETLQSPYTARLLLTKNLKVEDTLSDYSYIDTFKDLSVGVKYCSKKYNEKVVDEALLIGAYFTKVKLDSFQSIKDYCYTKEKIINSEDIDISAENVSSEEYDNLINKNYNFIDEISGYNVNFGGNLSNGISLHTDFGTICLENDICKATLDSIMGKQYLNEAGLTNLVATINYQLQRYKTNGYLYTNTTYSGEDLTITYNNKSYNVVKNGTALSQGFFIYTIPISQISLVDKAEKRFTPIYVVLETLQGARTVTIQGEVR